MRLPVSSGGLDLHPHLATREASTEEQLSGGSCTESSGATATV